jgi:hypothetical protein
MFERLRFARYALHFERAFRSDDWSAVRRCFTDDAVYEIAGTGGEYDGECRGPDAIVDGFRRMLDEVDRRYDRRLPGLDGVPRVKGGVLTLPWKARYVAGSEQTVLHGVSTVRFAGGKIAMLRDTMKDPVAVKAWVELAARRTRPV